MTEASISERMAWLEGYEKEVCQRMDRLAEDIETLKRNYPEWESLDKDGREIWLLAKTSSLDCKMKIEETRTKLQEIRVQQDAVESNNAKYVELINEFKGGLQSLETRKWSLTEWERINEVEKLVDRLELACEYAPNGKKQTCWNEVSVARREIAEARQRVPSMKEVTEGQQIDSGLVEEIVQRLLIGVIFR